jgi:hypothetical protein
VTTPVATLSVMGADHVGQDSTAAGRPTEDETELLPQAARTENAGLAWSDVDGSMEPARASWHVTWWRAAAVIAMSLTAAALIVLGWPEWSGNRQSAGTRIPPAETTSARMADAAPPSQPSAASQPMRPEPTETATAAIPPPPVHSDRDVIYLQMMAVAGVDAGTKDASISIGHQICQKLDQGESAKDIVWEIINPSAKDVMWEIVNPAQAVSHVAASSVVAAAVTAYCPKYENEPRF